MKKIAIEICGFILIVCLFFSVVANVLCIKDGAGLRGIKYLYSQEEDSIDVLVLGSSHAFENINTQILFDNYGIAAYILGGSMQPFWNSYFYLTEALKTQEPKLVVLEGFAATFGSEYSEHSKIINNNLAIKNPLTLAKSLAVSAPSEEYENYLLNYRLWHSRYDKIGEEDFKEYFEKPKYKYYKGFGVNFDTTSLETPDVDSFSGVTQIAEKEEKYFRMIVELCQERDIPIMVVISPYRLSSKNQKNFNYLEQITQEYHVPFVNYNSSEKYAQMGIDFSTDLADKGHLNYIGNVKYTNALAETINGIVDLPDRRMDSNYESWQMNSKDIRERTDSFYLANTADPYEFIERVKENKNFNCYILSFSDSESIDERLGLSCLLGAKGSIADGSFYYYENEKLLCANQKANWKYSKKIDGEYLRANMNISYSDEGMQIESDLAYGKNHYIDTQKGLYIVVYNTFTQSLVCVNQLDLNQDSDIELKKIF